MSDESDSDISVKFAQAHQAHERACRKKPRLDDSVSSSNTDDDDEVQLLRSRPRAAGKSSSSVDMTLKKMLINKAARERRRLLEANRLEGAYEHSSDEDTDEICILDHPAHPSNNNHANNYNDSSDEEDLSKKCLPSSCMSLQDLQRRGITLKDEDTRSLQKMQAAAAKLENTFNVCHYDLSLNFDDNQIQALGTRATMRDPLKENNDSDVEVVEVTPEAQTLHLKIRGTIRHKIRDQNATAVPEVKQAHLSVPDTKTVQFVLDMACREWHLSPHNSSYTIRFGQKTLNTRFVLGIYGLPTYGAVLDADITLLELETSRQSRCTTSIQVPPSNVGPIISLTIRSTTSRDVFKVGMQEKMKVLVERYNDKFKVQVKTLILDGDDVDLNLTPALLELEDEDLIDVQYCT